MVNSRVIYIALLLFFFNSCEEQPLVVNDEDLSLSVDTVSFDALESTTYQVPPLMGGSKYLYLGQDSGYTFNYNFIRASKFSNTPYYISSGKTISTLHDYIDSSIAIDSVKLSLNFVDDSVTSNSLFYLRYFPNVSDSVFSRNNTNYLNFNTNYSDIISYGEIVNDTTFSKLVFPVDTSYFKSFTDSSLIDFNNAFIVGAYNTEFDFYKFYSANNGQSTVSNLSVYFKHFVNDTLTIDTLNTHNIIDDLTILTPPDLKVSDTLNLSISLAKGLKSLITVDTKSWQLPIGGVMRKAELLVISTELDSSTSAIINSYPLSGFVIPKFFNIYQNENFTYDYSNGSSGVLINNILKFNLRSALSKSLSEEKTIHTFNLQPNIDTDPFKTLHFYKDNNIQFYPKLRITYVVP